MQVGSLRFRKHWRIRIRRGVNRNYLYLRSIWTNVIWGKGTNVSTNAVLDTSLGGKLEFGERCEIGHGAILATYGGDITFGDDCSVNPYCVLYGHGGLQIGRGVRIAAQCVIIPANHVIADTDEFMFRQGLVVKGVEIHDDVWIGAGVRILDGVQIARGCVVGAGSVVTCSTQPNGVYVGVPARRIRDRFCLKESV